MRTCVDGVCWRVPSLSSASGVSTHSGAHLGMFAAAVCVEVTCWTFEPAEKLPPPVSEAREKSGVCVRVLTAFAGMCHRFQARPRGLRWHFRPKSRKPVARNAASNIRRTGKDEQHWPRTAPGTVRYRGRLILCSVGQLSSSSAGQNSLGNSAVASDSHVFHLCAESRNSYRTARIHAALQESGPTAVNKPSLASVCGARASS
eukprot:COSAG02_NODE_69_length_42323_cov_23.507850_13_plen_203_part_00